MKVLKAELRLRLINRKSRSFSRGVSADDGVEVEEHGGTYTNIYVLQFLFMFSIGVWTRWCKKGSEIL